MEWSTWTVLNSSRRNEPHLLFSTQERRNYCVFQLSKIERIDNQGFVIDTVQRQKYRLARWSNNIFDD